MYVYGFIYVPDHCRANPCNLHIFFHGCGQTAGLYWTSVLDKTGLLEHASANNYVVIFPQTWNNDPFDLQHCWVASQQANVNHPQVLALRRMLHDLYGRELLTDDHDLVAQSDEEEEEDGAFTWFS